MEPDQTDTPGENKKESLDLSSLLQVDFVSRNWEEDRNRQASQNREQRSGRDSGGRPDRRDRRGFSGDRDRERPVHRDRREPREPREEGRESRRAERGRVEEPAKKIVAIQFFPEEHAFNALVKALRHSGQTHELFTLARLFLEKPERLMVAVNPLEEAGEEARMYVCKIDGTPFLSEDEVYQHVFQHHLNQFVTVEEIEVEAPKGTYQAVARCPLTKVLLCPPNYHRYPQAVLEHKERYFPDESVERVRNRLELVRDEEVIQQWLDSMRKKIIYRVLPKKKDGAERVVQEATTVETEEAPVEVSVAEEVESVEAQVQAEEKPVEAVVESKPGDVFESLEELKAYFREHWRHRAVKVMRQYRIEGKVLATLPDSPVRKSIELALEEQRRFPLDTANHLRGRFRRLKFDLFKHGTRGINYVSPVKRKIKDSKMPWSDSVEVLYGRIAQLSVATIQSLAEAVLGNPLEYYQGAMADKLRDDEKRAYSILVADLHWLVMEGYVTRFEDGHLEVLKASAAGGTEQEEE